MFVKYACHQHNIQFSARTSEMAVLLSCPTTFSIILLLGGSSYPFHIMQPNLRSCCPLQRRYQVHM